MSKLMVFFTLLKGYKTYLTGIIGLVASALMMAGYLTPENNDVFIEHSTRLIETIGGLVILFQSLLGMFTRRAITTEVKKATGQ